MKQITTSYILMIIFTIAVIFVGKSDIVNKVDNFNLILLISIGVAAFVFTYMISRTAKLLTYLFIPFSGLAATIISFILFNELQILFIGVGLGSSFVGFLISKIINQ